MQDKSKLGNRYTCFECGQKFYDLNRPDPLCPKCGADQRTNPNPDPREAILARFKGKAAPKAGLRLDDTFEEEEDVDEDAEIDEPEDVDEDEEEATEGEPAAGEEEE